MFRTNPLGEGYGFRARSVPGTYTSFPETAMDVVQASFVPSLRITGWLFFQYLATDFLFGFPSASWYDLPFHSIPATYASFPETAMLHACAPFVPSVRFMALPFFQYLAI